MDPRSEANLAQVHPDLQSVIRTASQVPQAFVVIYGIRTLAAEAEAVASGHSETMHSRHLPDPHFHGLAMAVDVAALIDGAVSFAPGQEAQVFGQIAAQIQVAADAAGIKIQWGGAAVGAWIEGQVSHFRDWGHVQLAAETYP